MTETTEIVAKKADTSTASLFTPTFEPIEYGTESNILQTAEPVFEVEKQYSFDTSSYQEKKRSEETMDMPTVDRAGETEIVAKSQSLVRPRLNARAKIMLSCYSIIVAVLLAFTIYSGVMISSYNTQIAAKTEIVAMENQVINDLQDTYNSLGESENIASSVSGSFQKPTEANKQHIGGFKLEERTQTHVESNWFEEFCNKLRKLFS